MLENGTHTHTSNERSQDERSATVSLPDTNSDEESWHLTRTLHRECTLVGLPVPAPIIVMRTCGPGSPANETIWETSTL